MTTDNKQIIYNQKVRIQTLETVLGNLLDAIYEYDPYFYKQYQVIQRAIEALKEGTEKK